MSQANPAQRGEVPSEIAAYIDSRSWEIYRGELGGVWSFRDEGCSPTPAVLPVVLLPGALGNSDVSWHLASALRLERRVISVTYPGELGAAELAQGLLGLLRARGIGRIALWGSSYGAWWAQAFAAQYPERTTALWLGNTFIEGVDVASSPLFDIRWLHSASTSEVLQRWEEAISRRQDDLLRRVQLYMLREGLAAEQFHERLKNVSTAKVLPVGGPRTNVVVADCEDDAIIGPAVRLKVLQRYPDATHVTFASGGHYPHVLVPLEMLRAVQAWLQRADKTVSSTGGG